MTQFEVGEHAVYRDNGVGTVLAIETKQFGGASHTFYVIKFQDAGTKVMIPTNNAEEKGLRKIISRDEANRVIDILKKTNVKIDNQTWNRRYREYMEKIKTGSVYEIAEVLRDLQRLKGDKELSFGERKMLDTARTLLVKEIAVATKSKEGKIEEKLNRIFAC